MPKHNWYYKKIPDVINRIKSNPEWLSKSALWKSHYDNKIHILTIETNTVPVVLYIPSDFVSMLPNHRISGITGFVPDYTSLKYLNDTLSFKQNADFAINQWNEAVEEITYDHFPYFKPTWDFHGYDPRIHGARNSFNAKLKPRLNTVGINEAVCAVRPYYHEVGKEELKEEISKHQKYHFRGYTHWLFLNQPVYSKYPNETYTNEKYYYLNIYDKDHFKRMIDIYKADKDLFLKSIIGSLESLYNRIHGAG